MGLLSRLVVKCVRSTTSLAVTMDLALGQVILVLVVSCLVGGGSSETLQVSSTGAAATKQGDKMGDYMLTSRTQNGHRVYEKTNGYTNFLYVSSNGFWTVGSVPGSTISGIYHPQSATPSLPPTSGWRYLDGKEWKADATLKVERKTASPAVDQSVLGRNLLQRQLLERQLLERQALEHQLLAQTAPRTRPSTAAVVPATRAAQTTAAQTTAPAAGCPFRIEVRITSTDGSPTNTDDTQPANRYAGLGVNVANGARTPVATQDYRGTYTRSLQQDANGFPIYTKNGNPAITISRVTTAAGSRWQMNGGRSYAAATPGTYANAIHGTTVPAGTASGAVCSTANPPAPAAAVAAVAAVAATSTATARPARAAVPQKVLCNLYGPHLIANSNASCPPPSGWSFKVGPTAATAATAGTAIFKRAKGDQISVTALP